MTDFSPTVPLSRIPETSHASKLLPLEFTGSGSEYFRIWIVNLLLTLVTFTLYLPWARARRLRYFMGNTVLAGQPLGFHGEPGKMFKGYVLVTVLFGLYSVAGRFSEEAGFVALLAVAALWPALFKSSLQFRLSNTSWCGLRFGFAGSVGGAYRALLPAFIPGLILVGALVWGGDAQHPPRWWGLLSAAVGLGVLAVSPWLWWNLKRYQHSHYTLGTLQTTFIAGVGSFYLVFLKAFGLVLLALAAPVALASVGMARVFFGAGPRGVGTVIAAILLGLALLMVLLVCVKPFVISRLQNIVWSKTGNHHLRFYSTLRFRALLWLSLKNWLLVVLTLGLYWPFATVAMTRLRLEAVTVKTRLDPSQLVADVHQASAEAAGDAAGDFFGVDVGL